MARIRTVLHIWERLGVFFSYQTLYRENKLTISWQRNSLESTFPRKPKPAWRRNTFRWKMGSVWKWNITYPFQLLTVTPSPPLLQDLNAVEEPTTSSALQHSSPKRLLLQSCCPYRAREHLMWHCSDTGVTQPLTWRLMTFLKMTENRKSNCSIFSLPVLQHSWEAFN